MYEKESKAIKKMVLSAGEVIKKHYGNKLDIQFKGSKHDILTNADLEANEKVINLIKENFPTDGIISEETPPEGTNERRWIIDPIDGTKNFAHGIPYFCTTVGYTENDNLILGATYDPLRDELFFAKKGTGMTMNDKPMTVSKIDDPAQFVMTIDRSSKFKQDEKQRFLDSMGNLYSSISSTRILGSQALTMAHVATGRIDASVHFSPHIWDIAAGVVMIREAGGVVTNCCGTDWNLEHKKLLASNGVIHKKIEELMGVQ